MSRHTRKKFFHKKRRSFTQRGGRRGKASRAARAARTAAAPNPPPRPPPKPPGTTKKAQQAPDPLSKRSQRKAAAERRKSETAANKAARSASLEAAGRAKLAEQGGIKKTRAEKKANSKAATAKRKANSEAAAAKRKKNADDAAAAKRKKDDDDAAAAKKKKDDDDAAAAKKKKADAAAAKKKGKRSMLPPMLSSALGALGSMAKLVGAALLDALDKLKDMMSALGDGLFGGDGSGGPTDKVSDSGTGNFSGSADSSCTPEQQAKKNEADAVRSKALELYPTNPKIALILEADKEWKKTMESAKPPITGNCEPTSAAEEEKEPTDATVPKTISDNEFLEAWRQCEVVIEVKPITTQTSYTTLKQSINAALGRAKIDEDKAAIYASSRMILDPINIRRYLDILKKQKLAK